MNEEISAEQITRHELDNERMAQGTLMVAFTHLSEKLQPVVDKDNNESPLRLSTHSLEVSGLTVGRGSGNIVSNVAFGKDTLRVNTLGTSNVSVGFQTLLNNIDGSGNTAVGRYVLLSNKHGENNVGVGVNSLIYNQTGNANVGVGVGSLKHLKYGNSNVALGENSGIETKEANNCTYIGVDTKASGDRVENEIVIGANCEGNGDNTTTISGSPIFPDMPNSPEGLPKGALYHDENGNVKIVLE